MNPYRVWIMAAYLLTVLGTVGLYVLDVVPVNLGGLALQFLSWLGGATFVLIFREARNPSWKV